MKTFIGIITGHKRYRLNYAKTRLKNELLLKSNVFDIQVETVFNNIVSCEISTKRHLRMKM